MYDATLLARVSGQRTRLSNYRVTSRACLTRVDPSHTCVRPRPRANRCIFPNLALFMYTRRGNRRPGKQHQPSTSSDWPVVRLLVAKGKARTRLETPSRRATVSVSSLARHFTARTHVPSQCIQVSSFIVPLQPSVAHAELRRLLLTDRPCSPRPRPRLNLCAISIQGHRTPGIFGFAPALSSPAVKSITSNCRRHQPNRDDQCQQTGSLRALPGSTSISPIILFLCVIKSTFISFFHFSKCRS